MSRSILSSAAILFLVAGGAAASPFTTTSPTGGALPSGVSAVGGLVLDLTGLNGNRVVSQLAASSLYVGYSDSGTPVSYRGNPLTIGIQSGFTSSTIAALGGGITAGSLRVTLYDGDSGANDGALASGSGGNDFDYNHDYLSLNGITFGADNGNFSAVTTQNTSGTGADTGFVDPVSGNAPAGFGTGFRNNTTDTGYFVATGSQLSDLYANLISSSFGGTIAYTLNDTVNPTDNYYDFTQGVDASLINVGTPPVVTPPTAVAEPGTVTTVLLAGAGALLRRRRRA